MLAVNSLRVVSSTRPLLLLRNRMCVSKVCLSTSFPTKDTWHCNRNSRPLLKDTRLTYNINQSKTHRDYCTSLARLSCWNCKQPLDKTPAFFCVSCKVVQPPEEDVSYFKIMACDYTFTLDTQQLQKKYLELQRLLHPDNFTQKSAEQEFSESQSALVNKAYTTLLKPLSRGLYMLELEGMRIEEGTDPGADSAFLMELMEINESLDEAQTPEEANKIGQTTRGKLADLTEQIDAALRKGDLQTALALLTQMKYHANIEEKVKEKLCQFM
ncbi:iron-sulfur cluster co-chaperone protein HscB isoform X2 [Cynoglossus semilaevis]|uniref:iron-sulfur cluster co-chaperone protein HscB isoform X2 n=1 Tax=Cynoglossus semilaevis TaxID=244447 RepID=UPI000D626737|nr:iron-sulfur cluster co-chaperone protein HscB, mitochondrial isoform X2 [Cynoglossus semilaevis]